MSDLSPYAFSLLAGVLGSRKVSQIAERFPASQAFRNAKQIVAEFDLPEAPARFLLEPDWMEVEAMARWCDEKGVRLVAKDEAGYPPGLLHLADPPAFLYLWGDADWELPALALVGTRRPTAYGRQVTATLGTALARAGLLIVSGLARGLDAEAHRAALEAGGRTVAVLGSGFQQIYPPENQGLAKRIIQAGCLVSEYAPSTAPAQWRFPARNRLIAALSRGVLVIEAGEKSGTLLTADMALELGRDVFAVPGSIFSPQSIGCLRLLKAGAKLVSEAEDVLEEYGMVAKQPPAMLLDPEETELLAIIGTQGASLEEILQQSSRGTSEVLATLSLLEVKGAVRLLPGPRYAPI